MRLSICVLATGLATIVAACDGTSNTPNIPDRNCCPLEDPVERLNCKYGAVPGYGRNSKPVPNFEGDINEPQPHSSVWYSIPGVF